ncbi:TetR/AcrR family transcriptional regulator [Arthrobacter sp. SLBN-53]|uniref:TetR/AcrR family transcriptional regulator n=1 Tax=Arthrobacter sp. SLBN-53 TaxID=2768412 RepID=UPI00114FBB5C|nr:TetR/AcrR family transcriptional regulator [Arthrobacter sp. SLBN-53]
MAASDKLIESTIHLIQRFGVAGTGIAAVLDRAGVSRRSIYLAFPGGKAEMVSAATARAGAAIGSYIAALNGAADPLSAFVNQWKTMLVAADFAAGCPIVAAALGRSDSPEAAEVAATVFAEWGQLLTATLRDNGIPEEARASLATMAIASIEGAVVMAIAQRSTAPLDDVHRHLVELIDLHRGITAGGSS